MTKFFIFDKNYFLPKRWWKCKKIYMSLNQYISINALTCKLWLGDIPLPRQPDRQTDRHLDAHVITIPLGQGVKTKVMLVTTYQRETKLQTSEIKVYLNNTMLENVNSEKLLGIIINKTLSTNVALQKRIWKYLLHKTRLTFYKTFIQPQINYFSTICGQSPHISRFHINHKVSLRLIMNMPLLIQSAPSMSGYANSRSGKIQNYHNGVQYQV